MLMQRLPLHTPLTQQCAVRLGVEKRLKEKRERGREKSEMVAERVEGIERRGDTEAERKRDIPLGECHR